MNTHTLPTTLSCQACVEKIRPHMDGDSRISHWSVDFDEGIASLNLQGDISVPEIDALLKNQGYALIQKNKFWNDTPTWRQAAFNTLNCLIGCAIGDFGMVIFLQAYYPQTPLFMQMTLAIIAGLCTSILLETILLKYRAHFSWRQALITALGMSFISMVVMEIAMTSTDFMITGGVASFDSLTYWLALFPALLVGFVVPLPYNYYQLKKYNKACH